MNLAAAQKYAVSIYELALEENILEPIQEELMSLNQIFTTDSEFLKLLTVPTISTQEKGNIIDQVFGTKVHQYVLNLLKLLSEKNRMDSFFGLYTHFKKLYNEKMNICEVTVVTAIPLNEVLTQKLSAKLAQITGKTVQLVAKVDPSVLGGVLLKMENDQVSDTLQNRLSSLKQQISAIIA